MYGRVDSLPHNADYRRRRHCHHFPNIHGSLSCCDVARESRARTVHEKKYRLLLGWEVVSTTMIPSLLGFLAAKIVQNCLPLTAVERQQRCCNQRQQFKTWVGSTCLSCNGSPWPRLGGLCFKSRACLSRPAGLLSATHQKSISSLASSC